MAIKVTDILELFLKAHKLELTVCVKEDRKGNFNIYFHDPYSTDADATIVANRYDGSCITSGGTASYASMEQYLDYMEKKKEEEKIKEQKRKEILARLTDEEKELLGLGTSKSCTLSSNMPF